MCVCIEKPIYAMKRLQMKLKKKNYCNIFYEYRVIT